MKRLILFLACSVAWCQGLVSGTYTSGITAIGTVGQTCALASFNNGGTGATATVALTGTNTIAGTTAIVVTLVGNSYTSAPTSATASSGTATCSGTAVLSSIITNAHPRLLVTSAIITRMQAIAANPADPLYSTWVAMKAQADSYANNPIITYTIDPVAGCANTNPVQCTILETVGTNDTYVSIANLTGNWAPLNHNGGSNVLRWTLTKVSTHVFSVALDATGFGSFSGQAPVLFPSFIFSSTQITYDYEGNTWLDAIRKMGVAWLVTGSSTYSTQALKLLDLINSYAAVGMIAPVSIDSGYPDRSYTYGIGLLYDWFYSQLSSAEKTATAVTVNLDYNYYLNSTGQGATFAKTGAGAGYSNYWAGHEVGWTAAAWATYEDNSNAGAILSQIRTEWNSQIPTAFASGGFENGFDVQGSNYNPPAFQNLLDFMLLQKTADSEDMFSGSTYAQAIARGMTYAIFPNGWQVKQTGDQPGNCSGIGYLDLPIELSYILDGGVLSTTEGQWAQYYYQNYPQGSVPGGGGCTVFTFPTSDQIMLFYDPTRTATNWKLTTPTYLFSAGDNSSYYRSDWTSSGILGMFLGNDMYWETLGNNSALPAHEGLNAGDVEIVRGSDWILTAANDWKGTLGVNGAPQNTEVHESAAKNTLFFNDGGVYLPSSSACSNPTVSQYCGGQEYWSQAPGTIYHNETSAYVYSLTDLTEAYDLRPPFSRNNTNRTLRSFWRSFLAVGDGTFVVLDRILKKVATYESSDRWFLTTNTPVISANPANQFYDTIGSSKIAGYVSQPLGGTAAITSSCTTVAALVCWVKVADPMNSTSMVYHTVLYATSTAGSMPVIQGLTGLTSNFSGLEIDDTNPKVVVQSYDLQTLGNAYQGSGPVFYSTVTYTTASAFTGVTVHHFISQITSGTYGIYQGGSHITDVTVGSDGVAAFTSTGGGTFGLGTPTGTPPTITTTCPMAGGVIGVHYSQTLQATGDQPYVWDAPITGLPTGITQSGGVISGTPTVAGTYNFSIQAHNGSGSSTNGPISCSPGIVITAAPVVSGGAGLLGRGGLLGNAGIIP